MEEDIGFCVFCKKPTPEVSQTGTVFDKKTGKHEIAGFCKDHSDQSKKYDRSEDERFNPLVPHNVDNKYKRSIKGGRLHRHQSVFCWGIKGEFKRDKILAEDIFAPILTTKDEILKDLIPSLLKELDKLEELRIPQNIPDFSTAKYNLRKKTKRKIRFLCFEIKKLFKIES